MTIARVARFVAGESLIFDERGFEYDFDYEHDNDNEYDFDCDHDNDGQRTGPLLSHRFHQGFLENRQSGIHLVGCQAQRGTETHRVLAAAQQQQALAKGALDQAAAQIGCRGFALAVEH